MRKIPFAGIELTSQRVRGLRGTSELPGRPVLQNYIGIILKHLHVFETAVNTMEKVLDPFLPLPTGIIIVTTTPVLCHHVPSFFLSLQIIDNNNNVVVDSHIQRIVLATEETTVTQQVSYI